MAFSNLRILAPRKISWSARFRHLLLQIPRRKRQHWRQFSSPNKIPSNETSTALSTGDHQQSSEVSISTASALPSDRSAAALFSSGDMSAPITHTQDLVGSHGLPWYNTDGKVMDLILLTQEFMDISYASSIVAITVGLRFFVILPMGIRSMRKDPNLERDVDKLARRTDQCRTKEERLQLMSEVDDTRRRIRRRRIESIITPIVNIGTILLLWSGIRHMVVYYPEELARGGHLWFTDLTQSDVNGFLPAFGAVTCFVMGELGADSLGRPAKELGWKVTLLWRLLRLSFFPVFVHVPSAIFCYWVPHSTMAIVQSVVLGNPTVQAALGVKLHVDRTYIEYYQEDPNKEKENNSKQKRSIVAKRTKQRGKKGWK